MILKVCCSLLFALVNLFVRMQVQEAKPFVAFLQKVGFARVNLYPKLGGRCCQNLTSELSGRFIGVRDAITQSELNDRNHLKHGLFT